MKTCTVPDCTRNARSQVADYCEMHYYRLRRTGELGPATSKQRTGEFQCTVEGCTNRDEGKTGLCAKHRARMKRHGSVDVVLPKVIPSGPENVAWLEVPTYGAVHQRLVRYRGRAKSFQCSRCERPAKQWAYLHNDPNELRSTEGPFSSRLDCYEAMCVSCHKKMDLSVWPDLGPS